LKVKRALKQKYALLRPYLMMKLNYLQAEARVIYSPVDDACRQTIGTHFGQVIWLGIISRLKRNTPRAELEAVSEFSHTTVSGVSSDRFQDVSAVLR